MKISKAVFACGAVALCVVSTSAFAADTEQDARLREALRQKMSELGPGTPAEPVKPAKAPSVKKSAPAAPAAPATPVEPAPVAAPVAAQPAPAVAPAQAVADDAQAERMREALRLRLQQEQANPTTPAPVVAQGSDLEPAVSTTKVVSPGKTEVKPAPFEVPASPLPASKEERLAQLLQQYKADLITPEQYHLERARIVAE